MVEAQIQVTYSKSNEKEQTSKDIKGSSAEPHD